MNPSSVAGMMGRSVSAAYPRFKREMSEPPLRALNELAEYEQDNPVGSALGFMGNVVAGRGARGFSKANAARQVFRGVDDLERFEIADNLAKFNSDRVMNHWDFLKGDPKTGYTHKTVGEVLEHPELFENYPELKDIELESITGQFSGDRTGGYYKPEKNLIAVSSDQTAEGAKSTLLHEIQHAIQGKENFAKGGSPQDFYKSNFTVGDQNELRAINAARWIKDIEQGVDKSGITVGDALALYSPDEREIAKGIIKSRSYEDILKRQSELSNLAEESYLTRNPLNSYERLAGEVESRNVQGRMNMTPEERRLKPFLETMDVPAERQIIRKKGGIMVDDISRTAEDFELNPKKMKGLRKGVVAFKDGEKVYSAKIGGKFKGQEIYNHTDLGIANDLDFDKAIPGFLDEAGNFVEQYPNKKSTNMSDLAERIRRMQS